MELHAYPRPANDTGIGMHWTVGYATAAGLSKIREFWLPEMKSMGVKWVKIFNHDGALDFCELLLAEGIMPVVRIYRPSPNPGRMGVKELVHLDAMIRAGVRYFEFNNEPDVDAEWKGGRVPVNGLELTVENTIANLEIILERGGMPAIPAVANGSRWDLVGKIVGAGRKDLFDGPVWQAIHNYSRNRPLDYPYDIGNQEGAAFTERFYGVLAAERWTEDAWRGRSLGEVNRLRFDRRSPGATVMDDHLCFLAYEYFDTLNRKHLGRSLPILSTENGYLVGEDVDPRYPAMSPDLHMAQTLEMCRILMGTSQRFKHAADYYFCTAFWLLANEQLGSTSPWWESHAWYSERWPSGQLPAVRALQAEPKVARLRATEGATTRVVLKGSVANAGDQRTIELERDGLLVARTTLDAGSRFELPDLEPGRYVVRIAGGSLAQPVELSPDQPEVVVNLDAGRPVEVVSRSVIVGTVRGGAGAVVMLLRQVDGEEWVTMARDDGTFRFVDLPPGTYGARVYPSGSETGALQLDGRNEVAVELIVSGWGYTVSMVEDTLKIGAIAVTTPGRKGLRIQAHSADWSSEPVLTGTASDYGPFAALISPLEADHYMVTVDGAADELGKSTQLEAPVHVDKRLLPLVEFVYSEPAATVAPQASAITGRVVGALRLGQPAQVLLTGSQSQQTRTPVDEQGRFGFAGLAAGLYTVSLAGFESVAVRSDIALDGRSQVEIELLLPDAPPPAATTVTAGQSVVSGVAPVAARCSVRLIDAVGNERRARVDAEGQFRFEQLPAGVYALFVEGGYQQSGLELDGIGSVAVEFAAVAPVWETTVTNVGSMPGFSSVRVEVEGMPDLPVRIWQGEEEGQVARTGSVPLQGKDLVEFKPLGPGLYLIEPEGLGVWASVDLTGLEAVWVSFRRKTAPIDPNIVRPVAAALRASAALSVTGQAGPASTYLYVVSAPQRAEDLVALLRYVAKAQPAIGCELEVAAKAGRVILLDEDDSALSDAEYHLLVRNVAVDRVRGDWSSFFAKLGA